ncbi:MAG: inositol monophosphatase [Candidatus Diapherotrites archaeon CG10_big_fil_rev_8_21_14_0_10_31_34]|nr:MAG: inositol monophosphatase [Candidatus Diapherotrites archaeon CG10_big_fil_rev_8_21_14_0_10_31_34]
MQKDFLSIGILAAKKAGKIISSNRGKFTDLNKVKYKGERDIVTKVDFAAEKIIKETILKKFPSHEILAEETPKGYDLADYLWVVDPLDGTVNFSHDYPHFCVSIALKQQEQTVLGVIFDPVLNELFTSVKGKGTYLNGKKVFVSKNSDLIRILLNTGFSYNRGDKMRFTINAIERMLYKIKDIRRSGSAALDLAYVACGRVDSYLEYHLKPWDLCAGALMVEEAGGKVSDPTGSSLKPLPIDCFASNGLIHEKMLEMINQERVM